MIFIFEFYWMEEREEVWIWGGVCFIKRFLGFEVWWEWYEGYFVFFLLFIVF